MLTPVEVAEDIEPGPKESGYGYGLFITDERGMKVVWHGGSLHGFSSVLTYVPEERFTVVVLAAFLPGPPGQEVGEIARDITEFYLWEKMKPQPVLKIDTTVDPNSYRRLTGRYDYGLQGVMAFTMRDHRLYAQLTGQPEHEIFPRSPTEFFWKVAEASVTFLTNADGEVTGAVHRQGGVEIPVRRLPPLKTAEVPVETLDSCTGQYDYGSEAVLTITREGDLLFAQLTGQPRFEIVASSETNFHWRVIDAHLTFMRNEAGEVVGGVQRQNGRTFEVRKIK